MRHPLALVALVLAACGRSGATSAAPQPAPVPAEPSPFYAERCPTPPGLEGYAVVARATDSTFADTAYLRRVAHRVVHAWAPPHPPRPEVPWHLAPAPTRERRHELPHEYELWDEWTPAAGDTATVVVTVGRDGMVWDYQLISVSANRAFGRSLIAISERLTKPCHGEACAGAFPPGTPGDTLAVSLHFGARPAPGEPAVRWATNGRPPVPLPRNPFPTYPPSLRAEGVWGEVLLGFNIDTTGRADMKSVEVLSTTHRLFTEAVVSVLPRMRYRPAVMNCRKVPWSVTQAFRFSLQ